MKNTLLKDIEKNALEKSLEYHLYHNTLELSYQREKRRVTDPLPKKIKIPQEWGVDRKFNPFYVLKKKKQISNSISKKIISKTYKPNPPYIRSIPKKGGGERKICVYQLPDSAVSDLFYHTLLKKNKHRFSTLSYAYRNDRNIHFAIQDIANELVNAPRIFVAEFDFSDFFGSIDHQYLYQQFDTNAFLISDLEKYIIESFLNQQDRGIPQGTSISLFLANLVCWKLDRSLENEGIRFARYADDTIIWSKDYTKISKAFDIIAEFSKSAGIKLNYDKSAGISLLQSRKLTSEFSNTKEYIEFLGYRISSNNVGIKDLSIRKIKQQISYLLYRNLIQPINQQPFRNVNIPANGIDRDLITAIMQIRRYLYGDLSEIRLRNYINGKYYKLNFKGIMSYYPLITDDMQMKYLDRWLVSTILNVINKRKKLLLNHNPNFNTNQFPFNCNKDTFLSECKNKVINNRKGLMQIPSFMRIYQALRIGIINEGIEQIMNSNTYYYYES
jgi:hypothetical protein